MKKHLIIVPVYNEELNIINVKNNLDTLNAFDYIFINDGSKDNTEEILIKNKIPHISLIHNLGIGGAVQTGYKYAYENIYDIAVQFDGDGQHNVEYINDIIKPIQNNEADLIIGSRFINKNFGNFKSTKMRQFGISIISLFIKLFAGKKIYDTTFWV
jgi:glycosyltransferase involved in cell wall biosynthesis